MYLKLLRRRIIIQIRRKKDMMESRRWAVDSALKVMLHCSTESSTATCNNKENYMRNYVRHICYKKNVSN